MFVGPLTIHNSCWVCTVCQKLHGPLKCRCIGNALPIGNNAKRLLKISFGKYLAPSSVDKIVWLRNGSAAISMQQANLPL